MERIILAVQELLQNAVNQPDSLIGDIKNVIYGDPIVIQDTELPSITISPIRSDYEHRGSRYDQVMHQVEIRLIYNAKDFFGKVLENKTNFASAVWAANEILFTTVSPHGLSVGDFVFVDGNNPGEFNGSFYVTAVPTGTQFTVDKTDDPGVLVSAGFVQTRCMNKVFALEDAIKKFATVGLNGVSDPTSIAGVIQKNMFLPFQGVNMVKLSRIIGVDYDDLTKQRPFPSYEIVMTLSATEIADR